jgi:hypothetical protein
MAQPAPSSPPNMYSFSGGDLHITYATSSEDGRPQFTYQDHTRTLHFRGDEIRSVETDLGRVVSVSIRPTIDAGSTTFSFLVPRVNLIGEAAVPIRTAGITTLHKFSMLPVFNQGQLDFYTVTQLTGFAARVRFPVRPEVVTEVAPPPELRPEAIQEVAPERSRPIQEAAPERYSETITEVAPEIRQEGRTARTPTVQRESPSTRTSRVRPETVTEVAPETRPSETEDK